MSDGIRGWRLTRFFVYVQGSETPNGVGGSKDILKALTAAAARDR